MTEEQVKQIIVDMISNGELQFKTASVVEPFTEKIKTCLFIYHVKDGYSKQLLGIK